MFFLMFVFLLGLLFHILFSYDISLFMIAACTGGGCVGVCICSNVGMEAFWVIVFYFASIFCFSS